MAIPGVSKACVILIGRPAMRAPEGRNAEVEKNRHYDGRGNEHAMAGAVFPTRSRLPKFGGEDNDWQKEEDSRYLEQNDAPHAPEGTEKTSGSPRDPAAGQRSGSASGSARGRTCASARIPARGIRRAPIRLRSGCGLAQPRRRLPRRRLPR